MNALVKTQTIALNGLTALPVSIEVNTYNGDTSIMVGLPDNAVRESRTRVINAIFNSKLRLSSSAFVANFAPADVRKEGTGYDLPLAVGILASNQYITSTLLDKCCLVGELGLDGSLRPIRGALPIAIKAREMGYDFLVVPQQNVHEAAVVNRIKVYGANHLLEVVDLLNGHPTIQPVEYDTRAEFYAAQSQSPYDFADVKGQEQVKRACEVAAAGGHNLILVGSPGCGKSMMAKRIPSILPQLTLAESLETTQIHSIAGKLTATRRSSRSAPSAVPTTPSPTWHSSAAVPTCNRAKYHWHTTAYSFLTNFQNSTALPSKRCADRLKIAKSPSHAQNTPPRSPALSCSWLR